MNTYKKFFGLSFFAIAILGLIFAFSLAVSVTTTNLVFGQDTQSSQITETVDTESAVEVIEALPAEEVVEATVEAPVSAPEEVVVEEVVTEEVTEESAPEVLSVTTVAPELSTEEEDYHPGETATIFGNFFAPFQNFLLKVFGSDDNDSNYTELTAEISADETGGFSYDYILDDLYRPFYEVMAFDLEGNKLAETWFRDSSVQIYNQCGNDDGDGYNGNPGECDWLNGAINPSNSVYFEGDSTVHRAWVNGFDPAVPHSITFKYGTTKGGSHAYDYLTTWDASESWIDIADLCAGMTGCTDPGVVEDTAVMKDDPNLDNVIEPDPTGRLFTLRGGTITDVSAPTIVSGDYTGDSETVVTVTFTLDNPGPMCETDKVQGKDVTRCGVAIWFGAHIAKSSEWEAFDNTSGAGAINGSPYHVALVSIDDPDATQGGGLDNQMSADVIPEVQAATLTLLKTVINDNGGTAVDTAWTLSATGPTPITGQEGGAEITGALVDAGDYTLSESNGPAGYSASLYSCVVNGGDPVVSNSLTLAPDDVAVCTITNDDIAPTLTLTKTVINDNGGTAVANDFQAKIDGGNVSWSAAVPVSAGAHTASETTLAGYTATSWGGDCATNGSVSLALGENKTCSITNNDQQAYITVTKVVTNDNGGIADPDDFLLTLEGNAVTSGVQVPVNPGTYTAGETLLPGYTFEGFSGNCDTNGDTTVALGESKTCTLTNNDDAPSLTLVKEVINDNGGTAEAEDWDLIADGYDSVSPDAGTYDLSEENGPSGYTQTSLTCDNAQGQVTSVTLGLGEDVTCTFVNDDDAPSLTLIKQVVNDNGGTAVASAWTLYADANDVTGSEAGALATDQAGIYDLSESTGPDGYTNTSVTCDNGDGPDSVTIDLGETVTCTFVNDDNAPALHLRKLVTNDNGGTATVADFTLTANGTGANDLSGTSPVDSGSGLLADTWALSETSPAGYTASAWSCVGGTQNGANITLGLGQEATCTITNDDIQPKLTLVKTVVNDNGGDLKVADFPLFVDATSVTSGVSNGFDAGSYTASETEKFGYAAGDWGGACAADGSVTLAVGDDVTCTITNDDVAPVLHLRKVLINDNGGPATLADFVLTADGTDDNDVSGVSPVNSDDTLQPDTWVLSETNQSGYIASDWVCVGGTQNGSSITLGIGEEATCTITNNDTPGHFTGGGSFFPLAQDILAGVGKNPKDNRVTHGFTLHCDASRNPNRLEVNWGPAKSAQRFHLLTLNTAVCTDNPAIDPQQPNADFDTIEGTGTGRFNGVDGASVWFKFDDAGEPGKNDRVWIKITNSNGVVVLDTGNTDLDGLKINVGNQQAHQDN